MAWVVNRYGKILAAGGGALLLLAAILLAVYSRREPVGRSDAPTPPPAAAQRPDRPSERLEARERHINETAWATEMLGEKCALTFEGLWDAMNAASNKLDVAAAFPVGELVLGRWDTAEALPHGIERRGSAGPGKVLDGAGWRGLVAEFAARGWELTQAEFRHVRFDTNGAGAPQQSHFDFSAHLVNPGRLDRAIVRGDLVVDWAAPRADDDRVAVTRLDASRLLVLTRHGEAPFRPILEEHITPPDDTRMIDPLLVYDLDGDGYAEILLAAKNLVYRRQTDGTYVAAPLCHHPPGLISAAVVADFDGDGHADFLCANSEGLLLFRGSPTGTFDEPGRLVWKAESRLKSAVVLTCGDIDHDGDLDLFLGQYRVPTIGQILKPHYYDANDGYSGYLLLNDGQGGFTDATVAAGLAKNRWRRTFSASFVDLDQDGNPDLLVVNDFAGADLYRGDGRGHFTEVTRDWLGEAHAFGMSHTIADFNRDGRLDLLMIGMNSPTADRLEHLGSWRPDAGEDRTMRSRMTFGNRLWLAKPDGGYEQTPLNDALAHSGWSWGCSAADLDNDGFPDVCIANGHETKQYVHDYEPEFWLHDIYIDESVSDVAATGYFLTKFARTRGSGWSYGGYEKNRLYLNQAAQSFLEAGHLLGVALEQDSRNLVTDDLDGDGRPDLLVTTLEVWPEAAQTLRVFQNTLPDTGNWIGFRFCEEGAGRSPVGVTVTLRYEGHTAVQQIVTGDSFRSQHATTLHFGLGRARRVDSAVIRWPGGQVETRLAPPVNRYHRVAAEPTRRAAP